MKKTLIVLMVAMLMTSVAFAKGYEAKKQAGPYDVTVMMDKNPPVMGNNTITIAIKNSDGKDVKGAKVAIFYGMPAMPGMPAMNYKAPTKPDGSVYTGTLNFSMSGPWFVKIKIKEKGTNTETVNLNIDIR